MKTRSSKSICLEGEDLVRLMAVSGYKGSGKTRVIEGLVEELVERGYKVGTVKHIPQEDFTFDQSDTDTWRHAKAGSEKIFVLSPGEVASIDKREAELEDILLDIQNGLDFVVLEGFKNSKNIVRVLVTSNKKDASELVDDFTVAFVGKGTGDKPVFEPDESSAIADLVEEKAVMPVGGLDCGGCGFETCRDYVLAAIEGEASKNGCVALKDQVSLKVDGTRVPLKPFVKDLIAKMISGMVSSLKKGEGRKIEIEVERDEG